MLNKEILKAYDLVNVYDFVFEYPLLLVKMKIDDWHKINNPVIALMTIINKVYYYGVWLRMHKM